MGDPLKSIDEAAEYRWRSAVVPYRPPSLRSPKRRKAAAGQMLLPGLEVAEPESGATCPATAASGVEMICPNCGGTEFDDEGDCTCCWEPGVARGGRKPPF